MNVKILTAATVFALTFAAAQASEISNVWPDGKMPGRGADAPEKLAFNGAFLLGENISTPTIEFFRAKSDKPTGLVVICPGGGYQILAYDIEGTKIAERLAERGISAAVLKYRVPNNRDGALMDAQRAIRTARANADKWNIDPDKIGIMGFSAGGSLSARASTMYGEESYEAIDETDKLSATPNYTVLIYGAYLDEPTNAQNFRGGPEVKTADYNIAYEIAEELPVNRETPRAFIAATQDDFWCTSSIAYYLALKKAGVPVDMHLFDKGGHGYGIHAAKDQLVAKWIDLLGEWLDFHGMTGK